MLQMPLRTWPAEQLDDVSLHLLVAATTRVTTQTEDIS